MRLFLAVPAAMVVAVASSGCGGGPSISTGKVVQFSETFTEYASAVERIETRWEGGLDEKEQAMALEELGILRESLIADASNVKTDAMVERLEGLGSALVSVPTGPTKVAGWALLLGAGLLGLFGRKKKPKPKGV